MKTCKHSKKNDAIKSGSERGDYGEYVHCTCTCSSKGSRGTTACMNVRMYVNLPASTHKQVFPVMARYPALLRNLSYDLSADLVSVGVSSSRIPRTDYERTLRWDGSVPASRSQFVAFDGFGITNIRV